MHSIIMNSVNMNGKIKKYISYKGYGFIELQDSDEDLFFHVSNFPRTALPATGQDVEFKVVETPKGKEAIEIQVIQKTSDIFETQSVNQDKPVDLSEENEVEGDLDKLTGVGPKYQQLLQAVGINTTDKLVEENPTALLEKMAEKNQELEITKRLPRLENVEAWINLVNI